MLSYIYIMNAAMFVAIGTSIIGTEGLLLCDGDCLNNTELDICTGIENLSQVITLFGLFPCNSEVFRARGLNPAAQMAINQINNRTDLLPGYELQLLVNSSMCAPEPAENAYLFQIDNGSAVHGIIGPGCSSAAHPVAKLAQSSNLFVVSYTATSPDLTQFPNFFRTISSDDSTVDLNVAVIQEFGWHQVAIITENATLFITVTDQLTARLEALDIDVISDGLTYYNDTVAESIIETIQGSGVRVVIMNVFEDSARILFCLAFSRGMIYPEYTWMSYGWYTEGWWTHTQNTNCTIDELQTAINRSLSFHHFPLPTQDEEGAATDVNYTPNEFWRNYESIIHQLGYPDLEAITQSRYVYDAVWMAAFALNNSIEVLAETNQTLEDFTYENEEIGQVFIEQLSRLQFRGVSGHVIIENRERLPNLRMEQYRYNNGTVTSKEFATLPNSGGSLQYVNGESSDTVFPGMSNNTVISSSGSSSIYGRAFGGVILLLMITSIAIDV